MGHSGTLRPYRPSNGTEGDIFMAEWCERCALSNFDDPDTSCMINLRALAHSIGDPEYPAEWNYTNGGIPQCTAFTSETPCEPRCDKTLDMFAQEEQG
ncbi:MAG: hypothetical protein WA790_00170 [Sulfitobacter sp.]